MRERAMSREHGEHKRDKGRRRCEVRTLCSSPNTSPATPIDGARHPVWGLSRRYFERASIIRWQGIRAGAPPMLLLARNPRAAEQRDTPSTKPARDYPAPETADRPDQARVGSDKPLRSGPKTYRPLTDHGTNATDHHASVKQEK